MIRNYFILAIRNLRKRFTFSFINIFGLALGISACLVILKYMDFELSYDSFNKNSSSLYRMNRVFIKNGERMQKQIMTTYGLGPAMQDQLPEVKHYIRTHTGHSIVTAGEKAFHENNLLFVDSTLFDAFTFQFNSGDRKNPLDNPDNIVITKTVAEKYFGDEDPIGKLMRVAGGRMDGDYTVSAVIEDVPQNSHFKFDILLPLHNIFKGQQYTKDDGWGWNNFVTYVQLNEDASPKLAEEKFATYINKEIVSRWKDYATGMEFTLQPLREIHLQPGLRHDSNAVNRSTIYFFGVIAMFILFIAWINYINLSTARALERAREVGIKKAIGAIRSELVVQFLFESFVINFLGIILALALSVVLLPQLGEILGKDLAFDFTDLRLWAVLGGLFVVGTLSSGVYPAFVMSSFKITSALKVNRDGFSLRKALVVFQFAASLLLIAGTFVVYRQVNFMQNQNAGLQMDQMLIVSGPGTLEWKDAKRRLATLKEEARKIPGIREISTSGAVPGAGHNWGVDIYRSGKEKVDAKLASLVWIDPDFIPTYEIQLVAGRNFNVNVKADMKSLIVNEASLAAFDLGTAEDALHERLILDGDSMQIIGVAKNYNWNSLKSEFNPFVLAMDTIVYGTISVHLEGNSVHAATESLGKLYNDLLPNDPYEYHFLDDSFNAQYQSDVQFGNIFGLFAGLAVAISCLGLWGLASFTTAQKLKEISVRKVLGASMSSIVYLLCGQFIRLVMVAAIITIPIAWYGMRTWLNNFAFKVGLQWDLFVLPVVLLAMISLITVSVQVLKGASANPAKVLRSE